MTIQEMHYHVDQGLQKNASFVYSNFLTEEIDAFINKMVLRFVKDRVDRSDPQELGYEAIQKRLEDIRVLVNEAPSTHTFVDGTPEFSLKDDHFMWVAGQVVIGYDSCKLVNDAEKDYPVPLRIVPNNLRFLRSRDPFYRSSPNGVFNASVRGGKVFVSEEKYILKEASWFYVRMPQKVSLSSNIDCELAEHTHDEIVDLTVQHILEVIESPRYQSNSAQSARTE